MNREMFESGRRNIQGYLSQIIGLNGHQGTFIPIFFNKEDFNRSYALIEEPQSEIVPYEKRRDKMRGALSVLTDADPIKFVDMVRCLDAKTLATAKKAVSIPFGEHLEMSMLAAYFGLEYPQYVLKPSDVKLGG
jgi:hypothetical protein